MREIYHALVVEMHQPSGNLQHLLDANEWEAKEILFAYDRVPRHCGITTILLGSTSLCPAHCWRRCLIQASSIGSTVSSTVARSSGRCKIPVFSRSSAPAITTPVRTHPTSGLGRTDHTLARLGSPPILAQSIPRFLALRSRVRYATNPLPQEGGIPLRHR